MFSVVTLGRFCMASPTTTIVSNEYPVNYEQRVSFNLIMAVLHGPNITSWSLQVFPIFSKADFEWYLDLRRYGSVPHAGFGMGIERVVAWICKLQHVRETIPYPRMINSLRP